MTVLQNTVVLAYRNLPSSNFTSTLQRDSEMYVVAKLELVFGFNLNPFLHTSFNVQCLQEICDTACHFVWSGHPKYMYLVEKTLVVNFSDDLEKLVRCTFTRR